MSGKTMLVNGKVFSEYFVMLKGLWDEEVFAMTTFASDRAHAAKIAGVTFNGCYTRAEIKEI